MSEQNIHEVYRRLIKAMQDDPDIIDEHGFMSLLRKAIDSASDEEQSWFETEREKLIKEKLLTHLSVYLLTDKEERTKSDMVYKSDRYTMEFATAYAEEKTKIALLKAYSEQQRKKIEDELANNRL